MYLKACHGFLMVVLLLVAQPAAASPVDPADQIRQTVEDIKSAYLDNSLSEEEKASRVRGLIFQRFDLAYTSEKVVGRRWSGISEAERAEFVALFSRLLERDYLNRVRLISTANMEFEAALVSYPYATVMSKITMTKSGDVLDVNYRLRFVGGEWKVYDVFMLMGSLVGSYRVQFSSMKFERVLESLREKEFRATAGEKFR